MISNRPTRLDEFNAPPKLKTRPETLRTVAELVLIATALLTLAFI